MAWVTYAHMFWIGVAQEYFNVLPVQPHIHAVKEATGF